MHLLPRQADLDNNVVGRGIMSYPLSPALEPQKRLEVAEQLQKILSRHNNAQMCKILGNTPTKI